ncbi:MAG: hypothetical protein ACKO5K_01570 [Armatimonadota bacterium]
MSNPESPYSPPPMPRRTLSPWAWTGIGCAALSLLGFGGCAIFAARIASTVKAEMAKPFNEAESVASIRDIPKYPGAKIDPDGTKVSRGTMVSMRGMIPAKTTGVLAMRSEDPDRKILDWYDGQMVGLGYSIERTRESAGRNAQHAYRKASSLAIVQVQRDSGEGDKLLVLMRFDGIRK